MYDEDPATGGVLAVFRALSFPALLVFRAAVIRPAHASAGRPIRSRPGAGGPPSVADMNSTSTPRLDFIGLVVADMAASLAFYRLLGMDLPAAADGESHVETPLSGGMRLAWDTTDVVRSFVPEWAPPKGGHRVALAFACDTPAAVDAAYRKLAGAGHRGHQAPWNAVWGQRYAIVLDPDDNPVDLYAPLG